MKTTLSLYEELKRRNVLRVVAAYVVVSWLVIQIVETIFPAFGFGDAAVRLVTIVLAIGFIPTFILSWVFEITPEGLKKDEDVDRSQSVTAHTGKTLDRWIMVVLVVALVYFAIDKFVFSDSRETSIAEEARQEGRSEALVESYGDKSIAVLPFVNMSDDASNEYFSDGISEELLNLLAKIPELRVISRSSAFSYKGKDIKLTEVARELNVAHILEGSVRKAGNQVRITVQLIEARTDTHLWSATFDRTLDNIFAIQDEIASAVVEHIKITLLGDLPTVRKTDPQAYALYLQGQYLRNLRGEENLENAVTAFKLALAIDPNYAPAWAGIGRTYDVQTRARVWSREKGFALIMEALEMALAIDSNMANAWASLAYVKWTYQWDSQGANTAIDRGFQLEPNNVDVRGVAAYLASSFGQMPRAIELLKPIIKQDPLGLAHKRTMGWILLRIDRLDESIEVLSQVLALNPDETWGRMYIGFNYLMKGDLERALNEFEKLPAGFKKTSSMAHVYFTMGNDTQAQALLDEFIETYAQEYALYMASIYTWRGENDSAFEWLEKAFKQHSVDLCYILVEPVFKMLASDPRYPVFLEKLGLLEAWRAMPPEYGVPSEGAN